jgi:hypothetical protein
MVAPPMPIWPVCAGITAIFLGLVIIIIEKLRRNGRLKNSQIAVLMTIFIVMALITMIMYLTYPRYIGSDYEINNVRGTLYYNTSPGRENIIDALENNSIETINDGEPVMMILEKPLSDIISNDSELLGLTFSNGAPVQGDSIITMEIYIYGNARRIDINFEIDDKPDANITTLERIIVIGAENLIGIIENELDHTPDRIEYIPYYDGPEY